MSGSAAVPAEVRTLGKMSEVQEEESQGWGGRVGGRGSSVKNWCFLLPSPLKISEGTAVISLF